MTALHDDPTADAASPTPLAGGRDEEVDLLVVGAGPAGLYAATHLDPDQPLFPGHSSDDPAGVAAAAA